MSLFRLLPVPLALCLGFVLPSRTALPADASAPASHPARRVPRLLVLTDIGGDPDDQQSMVRLMLYANEFDIEGLVASAAGTPGELKEHLTRPEKIREIVEAYGRVRPNLAKHADGYPPAEDLLAKIKSGSPERGTSAVGDGRDTEGSRWVVAAVDRDDPRPLDIAIWGGQTDLAQALWRVRADRGAEGLAQFVRRFRVHDISDQDQIAEWIWGEFPGMFYVLDAAPKGGDRRAGAHRGMYLGGDESLVSREWMEAHVRQNHGPLGALYPPKTWTAPGPHGAMKEGDTPSWLGLLGNGLGDPAHPEFGGWGGRFVPDPRAGGGRSRIYRDARDAVGNVTDARATVWRWRPAAAADFAMRLDWCVAESSAAPHLPIAVLNGDSSRGLLDLEATAGQTVTLGLAGSRHPDGRTPKSRAFVYPEPGTVRANVSLSTLTDGLGVRFVAPEVSEPGTLHVVLELYAEDHPDVKSYRRAVIKVRPR